MTPIAILAIGVILLSIGVICNSIVIAFLAIRSIERYDDE